MSSPEAVKFAEVARSLSEGISVEETVKRVIECAQEVTGAEDGGVALMGTGRRLEPAGASVDSVERAEEWEGTLNEGPSISAARTHRSYLVSDASHDRRFPHWGPLVADLGFKSAVSTCLFTSRRTIGTLNLFSSRRAGLTEEDAQNAQVLASHAAVAIESIREESSLRHAIETRSIIGQAQGLLMERYGLDARRAFEVLRRYSQDTNTKLRAVAEELVATRRLPPPPTTD